MKSASPPKWSPITTADGKPITSNNNTLIINTKESIFPDKIHDEMLHYYYQQPSRRKGMGVTDNTNPNLRTAEQILHNEQMRELKSSKEDWVVVYGNRVGTFLRTSTLTEDAYQTSTKEMIRPNAGYRTPSQSAYVPIGTPRQFEELDEAIRKGPRRPKSSASVGFNLSASSSTSGGAKQPVSSPTSATKNSSRNSNDIDENDEFVQSMMELLSEDGKKKKKRAQSSPGGRRSRSPQSAFPNTRPSSTAATTRPNNQTKQQQQQQQQRSMTPPAKSGSGDDAFSSPFITELPPAKSPDEGRKKTTVSYGRPMSSSSIGTGGESFPPMSFDNSKLSMTSSTATTGVRRAREDIKFPVRELAESNLRVGKAKRGETFVYDLEPEPDIEVLFPKVSIRKARRNPASIANKRIQSFAPYGTPMSLLSSIGSPSPTTTTSPPTGGQFDHAQENEARAASYGTSLSSSQQPSAEWSSSDIIEHFLNRQSARRGSNTPSVSGTTPRTPQRARSVSNMPMSGGLIPMHGGDGAARPPSGATPPTRRFAELTAEVAESRTVISSTNADNGHLLQDSDDGDDENEDEVYGYTDEQSIDDMLSNSWFDQKVDARFIAQNIHFWRQRFKMTQSRMTAQLAEELEERRINREEVYKSRTNLSKVASGALQQARNWELFRCASSVNARSGSNLWKRAKHALETENEAFAQSVIFYHRLLTYLDYIGSPTTEIQVGIVHYIRQLLIDLVPVQKPLMFLVLEHIGETNIQARETLKIVHFIRNELDVSMKEFFDWVHERKWELNKDLLELKRKWKTREREKRQGNSTPSAMTHVSSAASSNSRPSPSTDSFPSYPASSKSVAAGNNSIISSSPATATITVSSNNCPGPIAHKDVRFANIHTHPASPFARLKSQT